MVTSAQFLLDSESRFREAIQMMMPGKEPEGKGGDAAGHAGMKTEGPAGAPGRPCLRGINIDSATKP